MLSVLLKSRGKKTWLQLWGPLQRRQAASCQQRTWLSLRVPVQAQGGELTQQMARTSWKLLASNMVSKRLSVKCISEIVKAMLCLVHHCSSTVLLAIPAVPSWLVLSAGCVGFPHADPC